MSAYLDPKTAFDHKWNAEVATPSRTVSALNRQILAFDNLARNQLSSQVIVQLQVIFSEIATQQTGSPKFERIISACDKAQKELPNAAQKELPNANAIAALREAAQLAKGIANKPQAIALLQNEVRDLRKLDVFKQAD